MNFDIAVIKEIILGAVVAAVCFGAPVIMGDIFPESSIISEIIKQLPFLGFLVIGLTIMRLQQRKKHIEKDD